MKGTATTRAALLRLLGDDDAATVALVKAQLARGGAPALENLRALEAQADGLAAFHLRDVIAEIEEGSGDRIFTEFCARFEEHGDLEKAAWTLAMALSPGDDFSEARDELDLWGAELKRRLVKAPTALDRVETLAEYLSFEQELRGNDLEYYEIENSLLPGVIERRVGIPISLTLVYILVAQRAGMRVDGVGLPGHFIARHGDIFFDPYHGGNQVGFEECKTLVEQQDLTLLPQHLAPATPRQMLTRMLTNIYYVAEQTDAELEEKVARWIEAVKRARGKLSAEH